MTTITELSKAKGNFRIQKDGRVVIETAPELKLFSLVPDAKIVLSDYTITFPDMLKDLWYHYTGVAVTGTTYNADCQSYTALLDQEWGPGLANDLPDIFIADLPPFTDFLDVRTKLLRTVAPATIGGQTIRTTSKGNWIDLDGGASVIESFTTLFQKEIAFIIDVPGGPAPKCYLRRWQSSVLTTPPLFVGSTTTAGYTAGVRATGVFANLVDQKTTDWDGSIVGPPPSNWRQRGGNDGCSLSVAGSWASAHFGDIEITPGCLSAA